MSRTRRQVWIDSIASLRGALEYTVLVRERQTESAQPVEGGDDRRDERLGIAGAGRMAHAHDEARSRFFVRQAETAHGLRGFSQPARTGRAGRDEDPRALQGERERLAVDALEQGADGTREPLDRIA